MMELVNMQSWLEPPCICFNPCRYISFKSITWKKSRGAIRPQSCIWGSTLKMFFILIFQKNAPSAKLPIFIFTLLYTYFRGTLINLNYDFAFIVRVASKKSFAIIAELHDGSFIMLCGRYLKLAVSNEHSTPSLTEGAGRGGRYTWWRGTAWRRQSEKPEEWKIPASFGITFTQRKPFTRLDWRN